MSKTGGDDFQGKSGAGRGNGSGMPSKEFLFRLWFSLDPKAREEKFALSSRAAQLVGMSRRTVLLWAESGAVQAILVGNKQRVYIESLLAYATMREEGVDVNACLPAKGP